jgi:hypothetical protein
MDMSIGHKGPISQLGAFEKPRILIVHFQLWIHIKIYININIKNVQNKQKVTCPHSHLGESLEKFLNWPQKPTINKK